MEAMKRNIDKAIDVVGGVSMGIVFFVTLIQVISRYLFQLNIPWSTDVIRITFIYTVFFGASMGMRGKGHLSMDLLMSVLPAKYQRLLGMGINTVLIAFLLFIVRYGTKFTFESASQSLPYLDIPISLLYGAIPLNALFMIFYLILQLVDQVKELRVPQA